MKELPLIVVAMERLEAPPAGGAGHAATFFRVAGPLISRPTGWHLSSGFLFSRHALVGPSAARASAQRSRRRQSMFTSSLR